MIIRKKEIFSENLFFADSNIFLYAFFCASFNCIGFFGNKRIIKGIGISYLISGIFLTFHAGGFYMRLSCNGSLWSRSEILFLDMSFALYFIICLIIFSGTRSVFFTKTRNMIIYFSKQKK